MLFTEDKTKEMILKLHNVKKGNNFVWKKMFTS